MFVRLAASLLVASLAACSSFDYPPPLGDLPGDASHDAAPPIVTTVDTGATITQPPGIGVGIFVEYAAGGHWHIWWTCDTTLSGLSCTFGVVASIASGAFANVTPDRLETDDTLTTPTPTQVSVVTNTTTGVDGVFFDTAPGATITVVQRVGQVQNGAFFYWVENGVLEGGLGSDAGAVSDPMQFVPSSP